MKEIEILSEQEIEQARKKEFLESFEEKYKDEFLPQTMSDADKNQIMALTDKQNTRKAIITAIPMICRAEACEFKNTCPLFKQGIAPRGEGCPIEFGIVRHFMKDFMESLEIDPDNIVEMLLVRDMVDQEVQMLRATKILAQESFIQENVVGVDADGDPIMQKQLHLATDYQDKLHKRRQILFKQFLATRSERMKAGVAVLDSAQGVANLMNNIHHVQEARDAELKRQLGIVDVDDYIEAKKAEKKDDKEG